MIAGALGIKPPKLTDEQKAYQKAIMENEKKRKGEERERERQRNEDAEKARARMWDE